MLPTMVMSCSSWPVGLFFELRRSIAGSQGVLTHHSTSRKDVFHDGSAPASFSACQGLLQKTSRVAPGSNPTSAASPRRPGLTVS